MIVCLCLFVPQVKATVKKLISLFTMMDIGTMKEYIKSFGAWAPVISLLLMMFQSIAAPLPAFIITFANAWLFGCFFGAVLSWSGAMIGALLCFYISKFYGRPASEKFVGKKALDTSDKFFEKYGPYAILIARLLTFISFDAVSYASGLTSISLWNFLWSTGLGQLPATIVYSVLGQNIDKASKLTLVLVKSPGICKLLIETFTISRKSHVGLFTYPSALTSITDKAM